MLLFIEENKLFRMKFLSNILEFNNENVVTKDELKLYIEKVGKKLQQDIQFILTYCNKYNVLSQEAIEEILSCTSSSVKKLASKYSMSEPEMKDLYKLLVGIGNMKKQLPQYQSPRIRQAIISGKKTVEDMSLDLESEKGREAAVKQYWRLIQMIAHQYDSKSSFSHEELISSALDGFTLAMNDYQAPDENYLDFGNNSDSCIDKAEAVKLKGLSFKQYAAQRMKWKILDDMNNLSRTVKLSKTQIAKNAETDPSANFNVSSIDLLMGDGPDAVSKLDRMKELAVDMEPANTPDEDKSWKKIFAMIDAKFNVKQTSIFYKVFGLNGFKKMQAVEVAKEIGCSKPYISQVIKKITTFLRDDPRTSELLMELKDMYMESLVIQNFNKRDVNLMEVFATDDVYMLLEDMTKWNNKGNFKTTLVNVLNQYDRSSRTFILNCLREGFEWLDSNYRVNKKLIIHFLENMYPTETLAKKSDVYILRLMEDIISTYKKYNLSI